MTVNKRSLHTRIEYMEIDAFDYFEEAVRVFRASKPTIGSDALARQLLDYCLLRICGLLEQKIKNMHWYAVGDDVTLYQMTIPHNGLIEENQINGIFKLYKSNLKLGSVGKNDDSKIKGKKVIDNMKKILADSTRESYDSISHYIRPLQATRTLSRGIRGGSSDSFVCDSMNKAKEHRNRIAHNGVSVYRESEGLQKLKEGQGNKEGRGNILCFIGILLYLDAILTAIFQKYRAEKDAEDFYGIP